MSRLRCVVVDSGVDAGHPALRNTKVLAGPSFDADGICDPDAGGTDLTGHGSSVAALIAELEPEVEIVSLRVFEGPTCDFAAVLHALQAALEQRPALINLSLGTTSLRYRDTLQQVVAAASDQGCRIVAAASYGGLPCDPGAIDGVEAVVADANVVPQVPVMRPHGGRLIWYASPLPPKDAKGGRRLVARGDSLAVARVTGFLARQARASHG